MKKIYQKELVLGGAILVTTIGIISAIGIMTAERGNMRAQVYGGSSSLVGHHGSVTYGIGHNEYGQQTGLTFKNSSRVTVTACGGGGGGGGGGFGWEDGDDEGSGGGAGGGGGKGVCLTRAFKLRAGDTIRWLVGHGGHGGVGAYRETHDNFSALNVFVDPTYGADGGTTYVSVNGADVLQAAGGHGGAFGSSSWGEVGGGGGWGGSLTDAQASWHKGEGGVGMWDNWPDDDGPGGRGGRGENNGSEGDQSTSGEPGADTGNNPHGGNGGNGGISFGGGGGGGGGGHWQDWDSNGDNYINTYFNSGGFGGNGGAGYITITW